MRKIILSAVIALSSALIVLSYGCSATKPTAKNVSQIRYDVFYAKDERFEISVFAEKRENPFKADGNPAPLSPFVSVKVTPKTDENIENAEMIAKIETKEKTCAATFDFKPVATARECGLYPETPLGGEFVLTLIVNSEKFVYKPKSLKNKAIIPYAAAIFDVKNYAKGGIDRYFNEDYGEIRVKLIENEGVNYWLVEFIDENSARAFLVDASDGETVNEIANQNNKNYTNGTDLG